MARRRRVIGVFAGVAFLTCGTARADAYIYWGSTAGTIGRADLDGSRPDPDFSHAPVPGGLAVDGAHIYTCTAFGTVLRTNLDGSATSGFIAATDTPEGVAVDAGHVYWSNGGAQFHNGVVGGVPASIGRADLDGSGVTQPLIAVAGVPYGLAVDSAHIYWADFTAGTIGRANLDGSDAQPTLVTGANQPDGVAVDGAHVYWTNIGANTIGRANLDGSAADQSFITGAHKPIGVAVDTGHVYWTNNESGSPGRADLDGSGVVQRFVAVTGPTALAVDALGAATPSSAFSFAGRAQRKNGFTIVRVRVPGRGIVAAAQLRVTRRKPALIKAVRVKARKAGVVTLTLRPTRAGSRLLARAGRFSVRSKVTYTPSGGRPKTATRPIVVGRVKYIR